MLEEYQELYQLHRKWISALKILKEKAADAEKESDYLKFQLGQ